MTPLLAGQLATCHVCSTRSTLPSPATLSRPHTQHQSLSLRHPGAARTESIAGTTSPCGRHGVERWRVGLLAVPPADLCGWRSARTSTLVDICSRRWACRGEGACSCLEGLVWAGVQCGGCAPPRPPQVAALRCGSSVFFVWAVCASTGSRLPPRPLPVAAAFFFLLGGAQGNPAWAPSRPGRTRPPHGTPWGPALTEPCTAGLEAVAQEEEKHTCRSNRTRQGA